MKSKYKPYPSYRDSGVEWLGEIPNEWKPSKLKYCLSGLIAGGTPKTTVNEYWCDSGDGVPWVSIADMTKSTIVIHTKKDVTLEGISDKGLKILPEGTILYSIFASLGKVAFAGTSLTTNQAILGLVSNNRIDKSFFYWVLIALEGYVKYTASSNTQDNLNSEKVANFPVALPLQEQQTIANYLDSATAKIDTLIEKQTKLIALLKEKRQAVISTAVTRGLDNTVAMKDSGVEWLGEIPEHWEVKKLKYSARIQGGKDQKSVLGDNGKYPIYGSGGIFGYANKYLHDGESVLLGRKGTVDKPLYVNDKFWTVDTMYYTIIEKTTIAKWLYYSATTINFDYYQYGSAVPSMTQEDLHNIHFATPSKNEQQRIVDYLDKKTTQIDSLASKATKAIELLKEKRTALISSAVTGKIDVREIV